MRLFILEDNMILSDQIKDFFEDMGYTVKSDFDTDRAMDILIKEHFDVLILDVNLPKMNGFEFCTALRDKGLNTAILMLTSRNTTKDKVIGLNIGADDYLGKPFEYEELKARVDALYRRDSQSKQSIIDIDKNIQIDISKRKVYIKQKEINLTTYEFNLLEFLAKNKGNPQTRKDIFENVWGDFDEYMFSRNVDVYVGILRKKLGKDIIKTVKGFGYLIE